MMAGQGPFGALGMGGMFSVVKVRKDQKRGDYSDPGWYPHPPGTVAYEYTGRLPEPARPAAQGAHGQRRASASNPGVEVAVRKPVGHGGHGGGAGGHGAHR